jgi:flagellar biosynthesis protein FlhA
MGGQIADQLGSQPRALYITAAALAAAIVIPGFPKIPLLFISAGLVGMARLLTQAQEEEKVKLEQKKEDEARREHKPESVLPLIQVDPLEVEIGYNLIPLVDPEQGGTLLERITNIRRRSALDMGLIVPPIRIRDNMELEPQIYSILIKGVEVGRGLLQVGKLMAMDPGDVKEKIQGDEFTEPVFGLKATWIETDKRDTAESRGYTVVDSPTIIATHLTEIIKKHADEILGRQEVKELIDNLKKDYPAVVSEVEEKKLNLGDIQKVLQNLLRERVSIRNMLTIMESLASYADHTRDSGMLTEYVRASLARQITADYADENRQLYVITVDPDIESILRGSIHEDPVEGRILALDPESHSVVVQSLVDAYTRSKNLGYPPVYLVSPQVRSVTFSLLEREVPAPAVLSYSEISSNIRVNVVVSALLPSAA